MRATSCRGFLADPYGGPDGPGGSWAALSADEGVSLLAARQRGVVSTGQLRECGPSSQAIYRRVQKRRLIRLHRNVYAVGQLALSSGWADQAAVLAVSGLPMTSVARTLVDLADVLLLPSLQRAICAKHGLPEPKGEPVRRRARGEFPLARRRPDRGSRRRRRSQDQPGLPPGSPARSRARGSRLPGGAGDRARFGGPSRAGR